MPTFSERHGLGPADAEIVSRYEASSELRSVICNVAYQAGLTPTNLRSIVCRVMFKEPDGRNWSDFPNVDGEVRDLIGGAPWYDVYDVVEAIADLLSNSPFLTGTRPVPGSNGYEVFTSELNRYFRRAGIGWQIRDGKVEFRGAEATEDALASARDALRDGGHPTSANELHEAILDLSR